MVGHEEQHHVGGLGAELQAPAAAGQVHERDRAPLALGVTAADHTLAEARADADRALDDVRQHGDGFAVLAQLLRHAAIGTGDQLLIDLARPRHALGEVVVRPRGAGDPAGGAGEEQQGERHGVEPAHRGPPGSVQRAQTEAFFAQGESL